MAEVINGQDSSDRGDLGDSHLATRGEIDNVKQPHVAKKKRQKPAAPGRAAQVVDFATERDKRLKTQQSELATRGKTLVEKKTRKGAGDWYVEAVKASAGTWAFRLRRYENGARSKPIYVSRVANVVYEMIREGDYDSFKGQLIESHLPSAVRAGHRA